MQPTRRSTLFLMELIMAILLFSLAATVCVQVFVKSHTLEKESSQLNKAVFASTSVAEIFRSSNEYEKLLLAEFSDITSEDGTYLIQLDKELCLKFVTDSEDHFITGHIYVYSAIDDSTLIYESEVKKYHPKEGN